MFNLCDGWKWVTLQDIQDTRGKSIVSGPFGSNIGTRFFVEQGVPVIRGNNLSLDMTTFIDDGYVFITEEKAKELSNCQAIPGDIIFTAAGSIGQVGLIPQNARFKKYIISNKQIRARLNDAIADRKFIYYWLSSSIMVNFIQQHNTGSSVPLINLSIVRQLPVPLPPLDEQRAIAHILGSLDDKIEANRRQNETLEATARALFQSWFVDFDPVHAKARGEAPAGMDAAIAALFPSDFEDSALGMIPRGWRVGVLDDLTELMIGGDWGKSEPTNKETEAIYCIRGADIPSLQSGALGQMPVRYVNESSLKKRSLRDGDIVVEISGGSPTQQTGRTVLVTKGLLSRLDLPLSYSNFCRLIRTKSNISSKYVYLWFNWLYATDLFFQYESGTTGIKNLALTIFSESHPIVIPPTDIMARFEDTVGMLFDKQQTNGAESRTLAETRDALLPRLVSGALRVGALDAPAETDIS